ncbi:hypothetical protein OF377_02675 [Ureaplasma sp. ES3154-GEN]|uniref:hypothetical protein n=1 Tax=Ureaplasma sp. ES3154-GEN TaxID=2984844 RepID=UPI0021E96732|nr:hypothetical protein [Ureaplasma sp. ES3154-GEN]MCV3743767.1 hypothetical protein [Ureaplasma sp. ES3154-GEN]
MTFTYQILCYKHCVCSNNHQLLHKHLNQSFKFVFQPDSKMVDFLFILGGDGTFINQIKPFITNNYPTKIIMVNFGSLGFNAAYEKIEDINLLEIMNETDFHPINVLKTKINNNDVFYSVNELMLWTDKIMQLDVSINDTHLETYKGSGLMVATQIGSSASNKSNNGAIIISEQNVYQYSKILPFNCKNNFSITNPIILHFNHHLIFNNQNDDNEIKLINDGQIVLISSKIKNIYCQIIETNLKIFNKNRLITYISALRKAFIKD